MRSKCLIFNHGAHSHHWKTAPLRRPTCIRGEIGMMVSDEQRLLSSRFIVLCGAWLAVCIPSRIFLLQSKGELSWPFLEILLALGGRLTSRTWEAMSLPSQKCLGRLKRLPGALDWVLWHLVKGPVECLQQSHWGLISYLWFSCPVVMDLAEVVDGLWDQVGLRRSRRYWSLDVFDVNTSAFL